MHFPDDESSSLLVRKRTAENDRRLITAPMIAQLDLAAMMILGRRCHALRTSPCSSVLSKRGQVEAYWLDEIAGLS